jgi:hypothetical protein
MVVLICHTGAVGQGGMSGAMHYPEEKITAFG